MSQFFRRLWFALGLGWDIIRNKPDDLYIATEDVLDDVMSERLRQIQKWGRQSLVSWTGPERNCANLGKNADIATRIQTFNDTYGQPYWSHVLLEEVYEALSETDPEKLREELVQVAAVAVSWCEDIDQQNGWNRA